MISRFWGAAGQGGKQAARRTVFKYGQAPRTQDPAASGVRLGEAGLRLAQTEPPRSAR